MEGERESKPPIDCRDSTIEQVHAAWLAAGARGDARAMRTLRRRHPQWLDLQQLGASTLSVPALQRICSWENFHLATVGASAIHTAAWDGNRDVVELLLEAGQDPDTIDDGALTPMMVSMLRYNVVVMRCVFRNSKIIRRNIVVDCRKEESRLLKQVMAVMELLIKFGADVEKRSQEGSSALHYVANSDALDAAKLLLDAGADIDAQDQNDRTPLHLCVNDGNLLVANLLVSRGAQIDLEDSQGVTPLTLALQQSDASMLQIMLNHHHLVSTPQRRDFAVDLLFLAVEFASKEAIQLVVDGNYAPVTVQNEAGETPFHRAIVNRSPQLMELLADLDPTDGTLTMQTLAGDSPVHYVARYGSLQVVETLTRRLSRVLGDLHDLDDTTNPLNVENSAGETCLFTFGADRSTSDERDAIVPLLLRHGARLFRHDNVVKLFDHRVVLHQQVRRGLTLWIQEISDRNEAMASQDARMGRMLLTDICVEWITGTASLSAPVRVKPPPLSAVLLIATAAGYARDFMPLLVELPLSRTAISNWLHQLGRVSRIPQSHVLLQRLHDELYEILLPA